MIGFGGAFTEAAAYTLQKLPEDKQGKSLQLISMKEGTPVHLLPHSYEFLRFCPGELCMR